MKTAAFFKAEPQIGDLDDGGIYVGLSAEDGKPLHAALDDLPELKTYDEALAAAEELSAEHPTAHVPTPPEARATSKTPSTLMVPTQKTVTEPLETGEIEELLA